MVKFLVAFAALPAVLGAVVFAVASALPTTLPEAPPHRFDAGTLGVQHRWLPPPVEDDDDTTPRFEHPMEDKTNVSSVDRHHH